MNFLSYYGRSLFECTLSAPKYSALLGRPYCDSCVIIRAGSRRCTKSARTSFMLRNLPPDPCLPMTSSKTGHSPSISLRSIMRRFSCARSKLASIIRSSSAASKPSSSVPSGSDFMLANPFKRFSCGSLTTARALSIREPAPFLSNGPFRSAFNFTPCSPLSSKVAGFRPFASNAIRRIASDGNYGLPAPVAATFSITAVASPMLATRLSSMPCATSARRNGHGLFGETLCVPTGIFMERPNVHYLIASLLYPKFSEQSLRGRFRRSWVLTR